MRLTGSVVVALALASLSCAARPGGPAESRLPEQPGAIVRVGDFGYGIVPDSDPGTRYAPDALPEEFRKDGLRVVFSGVPTSPAPNERTWGIPFRLAGIRLEQGAARP